ncbi:hypothetical protein EZJ19_03795 [Parasulfuritortus cantonensis]|uniref:Uncharacterized protein n=1 Tax=Parasulfuritortus cantonensis TaxID=2528202 RepID=A0A4R1BL99_9PROT|nr:hypothetical protein [Parasulfuritortus cantonensis]TCJ18038.1 hypothetical protein EZJ19_03795 [Parasulfuritortus cantonensis]
MSQTSQILPLASLQPGMRLAEAVRDRFGNIMLTADTTLTESHLAALRQRGIASVRIVPERIPPSAEELAAMRASAEARLRQIFRKTLDLPGNRRLFEVLLAYRLENPE